MKKMNMQDNRINMQNLFLIIPLFLLCTIIVFMGCQTKETHSRAKTKPVENEQSKANKSNQSDNNKNREYQPNKSDRSQHNKSNSYDLFALSAIILAGSIILLAGFIFYCVNLNRKMIKVKDSIDMIQKSLSKTNHQTEIIIEKLEELINKDTFISHSYTEDFHKDYDLHGLKKINSDCKHSVSSQMINNKPNRNVEKLPYNEREKARRVSISADSLKVKLVNFINKCIISKNNELKNCSIPVSTERLGTTTELQKGNSNRVIVKRKDIFPGSPFIIIKNKYKNSEFFVFPNPYEVSLDSISLSGVFDYESTGREKINVEKIRVKKLGMCVKQEDQDDVYELYEKGEIEIVS